jgi:hypothetical protein
MSVVEDGAESAAPSYPTGSEHGVEAQEAAPRIRSGSHRRRSALSRYLTLYRTRLRALCQVKSPMASGVLMALTPA